MKTLLISGGNKEYEYISLKAQTNHATYARLNNFEYGFIDMPEGIGIQCSWHKLDLFLVKLLSDYDNIIWVDADYFFLSDLNILEDCKEGINIGGDPFNIYNTGVIVLKDINNNPKARLKDFFLEWKSYKQDFKDHPLAENAGFLEMIRSQDVECFINILDYIKWNAFANNFVQDTSKVLHMAGLTPEARVKCYEQLKPILIENNTAYQTQNQIAAETLKAVQKQFIEATTINDKNKNIQNFVEYEKNKINPNILFSIVSIISEKEWQNEKDKKQYFNHIPKTEIIEHVVIITIPDNTQAGKWVVDIKENNYKQITYFYDSNKPFDFGSTRNFAKAWATGEFILSLDFDEIILDVMYEEIIKILKHPGTKQFLGIRTWNAWNHYNFLTKHYEGGNNVQTRIFRNIPEIIWTGRLHETVDTCIQPSKIIETQIQINHVGYKFNSLTEAMQKYKRNIRALCSDIIDNDDDAAFVSYLQYVVGNGGQYLEQNNLLNKLKELT